MRKLYLYIGLLSLLFVAPVWADAGLGNLLNKITLPLSAEQWVSTKTALVTVGVNATVSDSALEKIQDQVLQKLSKLSSEGEWHITSFDRSLDKSGLERLQIAAQARLPSSALPNLRDKAKAISEPGETLTIDDIQFTPSAEELRAANTALRNDIYQQAKDELARLNKLYPDQKYYLHEINFIGVVLPLPVAQNMMFAQVKMARGPGGLAVGDKIVLSATAIFASAPDQTVTKMLHG